MISLVEKMQKFLELRVVTNAMKMENQIQITDYGD